MASNCNCSTSPRRKSVLFEVAMLELESESVPPAPAPAPAPAPFELHPSPRTIPLVALTLTDKTPAIARIENYVEETVPRYSDMQFKWHFRMNRTSFQALLELVTPHTAVRTIGVEQRTLACVWYLSNTETFRSVADRFGMSKGSLHYFLRNFCNLLTGPVILPTLISWPNEEDYEGIAEKFSRRAGFPGVIGAMDGTYIPIPGPSVFRDKYICRKGFPAFHLQAVCDSNLNILDVVCAYPGSVHDSRVFKNSPLCGYLVEKPLPTQFHLLGDSAYALTNYLLTPFRDNGHLSTPQKSYNLKHSQTRVDVERCFGLLKGKFRKLKYLDMTTVSDIPTTIVTCCVLHNFILKHESVVPEDIASDEMQESSGEDSEDVAALPAVEKRNAIMYSLS